MDTIFKVILTSSLYASCAGIIILIFKTVFKNKISPKWHYIIWVVFVLKLIIPFGPSSILSLFNTVPQLPQETNFTQQYEDFHKSMNFMRQEKSHLPTTWQVKETSLSIAAVAENCVPYIWLGGVMMMLGCIAYANLTLNGKIKKGRISSPGFINCIFEKCKKKADVGRNIEIILQDTINTPAIFGILKPKIVLPSAITTLDEKSISYILLHELAHYKRKDLFSNYLLLVLQIIHWFNPIIWYCFKKIRQDMELAADERVLVHLDNNEQKEYGKALLAVLENFNQPRFAPRLIGMFDDRKNIKRRIKLIKMAELFKSKRRITIVIGVLCIVILSGVLLTNALPKQSSYNIGSYSLKVPASWEVSSITASDSIGELEFKKGNNKIGGIQILGYEADQPLFLPNHSITKSKRDVGGLLTKAVLVNLDFQPQAQVDFMQNENHLILIFESEKTAYDIYGITKYVSESELVKIAKSFEKMHDKMNDAASLFKLKTPYVGSASNVGAIINSLQFKNLLAKDGFSLKTDKKPYGISMKFEQVNSGLNAEEVETTFRNNATLMFALIDNVDEINFSLMSESGEQEHQYTRTQIQQSYDKDLREFAKDLQSLDELLIKLKTPHAGYVGPGEYPKDYPKLTITSGGSPIDWIRGDAFFASDPKVIKGNSNFGADAKYAKSALKPIKLKSGALITFKSDEVKGFTKPKYKVSILGENNELKHYSSNENSVSAPYATGTYLFYLSVVWGNNYNPNISNDNFIDYWFSVSVDNGDDESAVARKVVDEYFNAFAKADYKTMISLSTDYHNKNYVHNGDVWGMKWAKAKEIKLFPNPKSLAIENSESSLAFGVDVDMETVKTSSQYPSNQTFFYVVLVKDKDGNWKIDKYTTG